MKDQSDIQMFEEDFSNWVKAGVRVWRRVESGIDEIQVRRDVDDFEELSRLREFGEEPTTA